MLIKLQIHKFRLEAVCLAISSGRHGRLPEVKVRLYGVECKNEMRRKQSYFRISVILRSDRIANRQADQVSCSLYLNEAQMFPVLLVVSV